MSSLPIFFPGHFLYHKLKAHIPLSVLFSKTPNSWKLGALALKAIVSSMSFKNPSWNSLFSGLLDSNTWALHRYVMLPPESGVYQGLGPNCQYFRPLEILLGYRANSRELLARAALQLHESCFPFEVGATDASHPTQPHLVMLSDLQGLVWV